MFGEKLTRSLCEWEDRLFQLRTGLEIGGIIPRDALESPRPEAVRHANAYHAVWCRNIRVLLAETWKSGERPGYFIDVGAGKGKACFYAARTGRFHRIIGVELSPPLVAIARRNRTREKTFRIQFLCRDAAEYPLPARQELYQSP